MDHDIRAEFDRPEEEGRREGVVHHKGDPVPVGDFRDLFDVDDIAVGVAEGLDEQELRFRTDGFFEVPDVRRVDEGGRDSVGDERMLQEVIGAAVDGLGCDDMVPRAGNVQDGVGDGGGAGCHGEGAHTAFQSGDALLQDVLGGVGQAAVDVAGIRQAEAGGSVGAVMEDIGGCLVDGDRAGVGCGVGVFLSYMELKGLEVKFTCSHNRCVFLLAKLWCIEISNKKF